MIFQILTGFLLFVSNQDSSTINLHLPPVKAEHYVPYPESVEGEFVDTGWMQAGLVLSSNKIGPALYLYGIGARYDYIGVVLDDNDFTNKVAHKHTSVHKFKLKK